jgi:hypothetical protein
MSTYNLNAIKAVHAIAKACGVEVPNKDVEHCAVSLIRSLWNYTHETDDNGALDRGTYGWVVQTIMHMLQPDEEAISLTKLHNASEAVQHIRLQLLNEYRMERMSKIQEMRRKYHSSNMKEEGANKDAIDYRKHLPAGVSLVDMTTNESTSDQIRGLPYIAGF